VQTKFGKIHHADCVEFMHSLSDGCVNLIFADPPYNIGKAAWDKIEDYYEWSTRWIQEASRVLAPNGAFWVSHSEPEQLILMSKLIARHGRKRINWITWWKHSGKCEVGRNNALKGNDGLRSWFPCGEYLIFHSNEGEWVDKCDVKRGLIFEPLRAYLDGERQRAGIDKADCNVACGFRARGGMASRHYFSRSQWRLPTKEHYESLQKLFGVGYLTREYESLLREYESLRREYESLRREYESLRYTFNQDEKVSSLWQFSPGSCAWHPTPKPAGLLHRIINVTSNPGDVFYEPFAGSATGCKVAENLGRQWFATELVIEYVEKASQEIENQKRQLKLW